MPFSPNFSNATSLSTPYSLTGNTIDEPSDYPPLDRLIPTGRMSIICFPAGNRAGATHCCGVYFFDIPGLAFFTIPLQLSIEMAKEHYGRRPYEGFEYHKHQVWCFCVAEAFGTEGALPQLSQKWKLWTVEKEQLKEVCA